MSKQNYRKLTQREHVLTRPDTYIGTTTRIDEDMFFVDNINDINSTTISKKKINYSPGFLKIFDEALVNATDHYINTNLVKNIKIEVNREENWIEIYNDGPGVTISKNEDGTWIPEMIFFHFLSGSNFDDTEERYTGGRNGIGIKATATYSTKFIIKTNDGKKDYTQESLNNLEIIKPPVIKSRKTKDTFVSVRYYPDLEKFNMSEISDDIIAVIMRRILESRVYCGNKINIYYNNQLIKIKSTLDYFKMLTNNSECFSETLSNGWEVCVAKSKSDQFEHSSIVNGISTYNGGTHVNWVSLTLTKELSEMFPKKYNVSWNEIKNNIFILVVCKIMKPTFNSQTKEQLTNYISKEIINGSDFSQKLLKQIYGSSIVKYIIEKIEFREKLELSKLQKKKVKVEKLVDATNKDRGICELLIFEGDSAGQPTRSHRTDKTGFYCLRGKFINVQDLNGKKVLENKEAFGLMQAIGLKWGEKVDFNNIRFSKIIIATDADIDGDCITAQLLNFFSKWRELFERGYIYRNITPLLIVENTKNKEEIYFYEQEEYEKFAKTKLDTRIHNVHYKKGIGSLEPKQFRKIIREPILHQYAIDDVSMNKLEVWFGKNANLRKDELI